MKLKSTVDYDGVYKRQAIEFEAKSTENVTRFDLKNIAQYQLNYLEKAETIGAICFFFIEFSVYKSVFVLPLSVIQSYVVMSRQLKDKKPIPKADSDIYGYLVDQKELVPIDYL